MTRQPTPEELQRCAGAACLATGDEPTIEDVTAARDAIANPSYARPGSWSAAALAEWSRILAGDKPDARDAEIKALRERLAMATEFWIDGVKIYAPVIGRWFVVDEMADPEGHHLNIDPATGKWGPFTTAAFPSADAAFAALDAARGGTR